MNRYSLRSQIHRGFKVGGSILLALAGFLMAIYLVTRVADVPFTDLTRDPAAILEGPWYSGAISNLSIVITAGSAGIALFAASLLPSVNTQSTKGLLCAMALAVLFLLVDDLLVIHETLFFEFRVREELVFGLYGMAVLTIIWHWRQTIVTSTDYIYLLLAGLTLGLSLFVDVAATERGVLGLGFPGKLVEDPLKVAGYMFVTAYFIATSRQALLHNSVRAVDTSANSTSTEA